MRNKSKLRPDIGSINHGSSLEIESFQNEVIRPIIKMQHDVLMMATGLQLNKMKINRHLLSRELFEKKVEHLFAKNIGFKNLVIGLIMADFTNEEFVRYEQNYSEFNRRINTIVKKRVLDTF